MPCPGDDAGARLGWVSGNTQCVFDDDLELRQV